MFERKLHINSDAISLWQEFSMADLMNLLTMGIWWYSQNTSESTYLGN